jgi:thioredoxin-like negative regulator of GroEL
MELPELNQHNYRSVVGRQGIVLVLCWATACGACRAFEPVYGQVARRFPKHMFAKLNVEAEGELGSFFEISHTPTLMLYRDGLLLLRKPGQFDESQLSDLVAQAESLDMVAVRAQMESERTNDS